MPSADLTFICALCGLSLGICALALLLGPSLCWRRRARGGNDDVLREFDSKASWTATTTAGPARVVRVLHEERGWAYAVETRFRGQDPRVSFTDPDATAVLAKLGELTRAYDAAP